jgi:hypothetical protein
MVSARPRLSWVRRWFKRPQCAQVRVAPEVSSSAVLIAGMPHAAIGVNGAPRGPALGQVPANPGHSVVPCTASRPPRVGTEITRT